MKLRSVDGLSGKRYEVRVQRLTVKDSHRLYCLRGLEIARVAAVFAHVRNDLRILSAARDLEIAQNGGVIGAFENLLSDIWIGFSEAHLPADSISQSFGAHVPVQPAGEVPSLLVECLHRGIWRSRSHGRRISRATGEIVFLQQRTAVVQRRYYIHRSECSAIDPQRGARKRTILILLRAKRLHSRAERPVVESSVHHGYRYQFGIIFLGKLQRPLRFRLNRGKGRETAIRINASRNMPSRRMISSAYVIAELPEPTNEC